MDETPVHLNRELTKIKMRLSRLLSPHVQESDEALPDWELIRLVLGRYLLAHQP